MAHKLGGNRLTRKRDRKTARRVVLVKEEQPLLRIEIKPKWYRHQILIEEGIKMQKKTGKATCPTGFIPLKEELIF